MPYHHKEFDKQTNKATALGRAHTCAVPLWNRHSVVAACVLIHWAVTGLPISLPLFSQSTASITNKSSAVAEMGDHFATIDIGRKLGTAVPPVFWRGVGGAGSPSNTIWRWPGPSTKWHLDPSNRLATIHQRYRQTDRTERSDSIGRTVLQTVAQKRNVFLLWRWTLITLTFEVDLDRVKMNHHAKYLQDGPKRGHYEKPLRLTLTSSNHLNQFAWFLANLNSVLFWTQLSTLTSSEL